MPLSHGFADVNGTCLYYEMAGSGPALVLIHGHTLDARMWDDQFERFARYITGSSAMTNAAMVSLPFQPERAIRRRMT
jgi:pimeloyl-ACP methyl ester carboxylesterase